MGWSITIETDLPVTCDDIDQIIEDLNPELRGPFVSRQEWGWGINFDVQLFGEHAIGLGGSYSSCGKLAGWASDAFLLGLLKRGIKGEATFHP